MVFCSGPAGERRAARASVVCLGAPAYARGAVGLTADARWQGRGGRWPSRGRAAAAAGEEGEGEGEGKPGQGGGEERGDEHHGCLHGCLRGQEQNRGAAAARGLLPACPDGGSVATERTVAKRAAADGSNVGTPWAGGNSTLFHTWEGATLLERSTAALFTG